MISRRLKTFGSILMAVSLMGAYLAATPAQDNPFPWKFGGYDKIGALHLRYWSAAKDAFEKAGNFAKPDFPTEISEIWFSKSAQSMRVDKYVEKSAVKCNKFKGKEWETILENGIDYVLMERIIQVGGARSTWRLENIMSGGGTELCEYKTSQGPRQAVESFKDALSSLTISPYFADPEYQEMLVAELDLDKLMDPAKYKATAQEFKKTYDKAGRKTAKYETGHGIIRFRAQGHAFVDLEWGMGLEGYLTKIQSPDEPELKLPTPVCIYKVLSVETKIDDPKVFDKTGSNLLFSEKSRFDPLLNPLFRTI